jgi:hypothetical protein
MSDDEYNWVNVINPTDTGIEIATGEVLGHHQKTDLANMEITALYLPMIIKVSMKQTSTYPPIS